MLKDNSLSTTSGQDNTTSQVAISSKAHYHRGRFMTEKGIKFAVTFLHYSSGLALKRVIYEPAALATLGSLLEMQTLKPIPVLQN